MTTVRLTNKESMLVHHRWHEAFPPKESGSFGSRQFLWHVFSARLHPAKTGTAALDAYRAVAHGIAEFYVMSAAAGRAIVERYDGAAPDFSGDDQIVFPPSFAWTMCFTHEEPWLGPFFAMRADVR